MPESWFSLATPWRLAFECAVRAYLDHEGVPVGAVVVGKDGEVLTQGVNRFGSARLAHAEIEACNAIHASVDRRNCELWVTLEPCPMCTGAIRLMQLRAVRYAARDPAAGAVHLLGTTEFMRAVPCDIVAPTSASLEFVVVALVAEHRERTGHHRWREKWSSYLPGAVRVGTELARSGAIHQWKRDRPSAQDLYELIIARNTDAL